MVPTRCLFISELLGAEFIETAFQACVSQSPETYRAYFGQDRFVRRCDLTSYNLRENEYKLAVPQPRTEFYKRSLSYSGSVLWNGLPLEVRQLTSPSIFKGKLIDINFD